MHYIAKIILSSVFTHIWTWETKSCYAETLRVPFTGRKGLSPTPGKTTTQNPPSTKVYTSSETRPSGGILSWYHAGKQETLIL